MYAHENLRTTGTRSHSGEVLEEEARRYSVKRVCLNILQNSQENTCENQKETLVQAFSCFSWHSYF